VTKGKHTIDILFADSSGSKELETTIYRVLTLKTDDDRDALVVDFDRFRRNRDDYMIQRDIYRKHVGIYGQDIIKIGGTLTITIRNDDGDSDSEIKEIVVNTDADELNATDDVFGKAVIFNTDDMKLIMKNERGGMFEMDMLSIYV
jgi:hypothetical protein